MKKGYRLPLKAAAAMACLAVLVLAAAIYLQTRGTPIPVLMYHHFVEEGPVGGDTVVSAPRFEEQIRALKEGGYTSISAEQLYNFVNNGVALPPKPILITFDDGYTSNLTIAAPILERYGMTATIFVIGINVGEEIYPHSGLPLDPPRFSWEEAKPWVDKGIIVVQSHTYDMHQRIEYGFSGRDGVLPIQGEGDAEYRAALRQDFIKAKEGLLQGLGADMISLSFPFGLHDIRAVEELEALGVAVTFTTQFGCSRAVPGRQSSIHCIMRWGVAESITGEGLLSGLESIKLRTRIGLF